MQTLVLTTERGSTYVVGAATVGRHVRLARVSGHPVRGTLGPYSFAADLERAELVAVSGGLCLECTALDGQQFRTSLIAAVDVHETLAAATA